METEINNYEGVKPDRTNVEKLKIGETVIKPVVIPYDGTERQDFTVLVSQPNKFMRDLPA